jgi:uncharacterized membrane protein
MTAYFIIIAILSLAGFFVSRHIHTSKKTGEKLVCFIGGGKKSCNEVVESEYGKTFGIANEVAGIVYYAVVFISMLFLWWRPELINVKLDSIFPLVSGVAFFASVYLVYIQAFVLKKFCEWCLVTAVANTLIFLLFLFQLTK